MKYYAFSGAIFLWLSYASCSGEGNFNKETDCRRSADRGLCANRYTMYYYSVTQEKCLPFVYSGCLGNQNRFETEWECIDACSGVLAPLNGRPDPALCRQPLDTGCLSETAPVQIRRFFYDDFSQSCTPTYYCKIDVNQRGFPSLEDCLAQCGTPAQRQQYAGKATDAVTRRTTTRRTTALENYFQVKFDCGDPYTYEDRVENVRECAALCETRQPDCQAFVYEWALARCSFYQGCGSSSQTSGSQTSDNLPRGQQAFIRVSDDEIAARTQYDPTTTPYFITLPFRLTSSTTTTVEPTALNRFYKLDDSCLSSQVLKTYRLSDLVFCAEVCYHYYPEGSCMAFTLQQNPPRCELLSSCVGRISHGAPTWILMD